MDEDEEDTDIRFHLAVAKFTNTMKKKQMKATEAQLPKLRKTFEGTQPLEYYLCVDSIKRRNAFLKSIKTYDVVIGEVIKVTGLHLRIALIVVLTGQTRWINGLKIEASVQHHETGVGILEAKSNMDVGDRVKGVVTYVNQDQYELKVSFDEKFILKEYIDLFPLGKLDEDELEALQRFIPPKNTSDGFDKDLASCSSFIEPHCINRLVHLLEIDGTHTSFFKDRHEPSFKESVQSLREMQSFNCSMQLVGYGIKLFRQHKTKEAVEHFNQAISLFPSNIEAYVARGALRANKNEMKEALQDFRQALSLDANHKNGRKYMIETSLNMAKSFEKQLQWKDSVKCYKEILKYDPTHKEAKERYQQVQQILSNKILNGSARVKSFSSATSAIESALSKDGSTSGTTCKDKIQRLKQLLLESRDKTSSQSSSSTSSSDSESSDTWVERKNNSKQINHRTNKARPPSSHELNRSKSQSLRHVHSEHDTAQTIQSLRNSSQTKKMPNAIIDREKPNAKMDQKIPNAESLLSGKLKHFSSSEMELVSKILNKSNSEGNYYSSEARKRAVSNEEDMRKSGGSFSNSYDGRKTSRVDSSDTSSTSRERKRRKNRR